MSEECFINNEDGMGNSSHLLKNKMVRVYDFHLVFLYLYLRNKTERKTPFRISLLLKVKDENIENILFNPLKENPAETLTSYFLNIKDFNFKIEHRGNSVSRAYFSRLLKNKMKDEMSLEKFLEDNCKKIKNNIFFSENYKDENNNGYSLKDFENIPENTWLFNIEDRDPNKKKTYGRIIY